ncbi:hypothetical protein HanRHA438_Chr17g0839221 [Helianthus annuus]|uniref:Uncharacterized protein n=1 Tax=Helianthus annuus TaxID=4232 RepID=A0A9K3DL62_HELAN|nr:hypothetical protein HanXRQr2_Chr17g0828601 [Helianthus annuus]KAJ0430960.1 hypothetical protein HanHA300_Chr17g0675001 [Helianthus annuus]KAJ0449408.1 hypothetical protein HanHA89_Chr17g0728111 [Helianthus annuus]KAJ0634265.1 hypothetical protein HanLR1_Chr17g0686141 [Helianthus annuus]KAJ0828618.1 hypothetical protein HanRHA438_Chr17g0839221 [Helianthus annuus]
MFAPGNSRVCRSVCCWLDRLDLGSVLFRSCFAPGNSRVCGSVCCWLDRLDLGSVLFRSYVAKTLVRVFCFW